MKVILSEFLSSLISKEEALHIAKMLGYYMDEITLTENDIAKATRLYYASKGYMPERWGYVLKRMLERRTEKDPSWTKDIREMISLAKKKA